MKETIQNAMFEYLHPQEAVYGGSVKRTVDFVVEHQLKDKALWKKFANQFIVCTDSDDRGWRCEFWGKMMRGGCLTYMYTGDEELYDTLAFAVEELLKTQDEYGRISSYRLEKEFTGWDMWGRKYVMTGLQHFFKICKDADLKNRILAALKNTADYICEHIGEGKIDIRETSYIWSSLNSCSILEPFVELYKMTKDSKYLDFAKYVIDCGGCGKGDLLQLVLKGECYPFEFPVRKAYEMMSFFEGVLAYYEVTGEEYYFNIVKKFVEDVYKTERTAIGGIGGRSELFDDFYTHQTEKQPIIVQETCVTVTWMRLLARLYFQTGDVKYIDRIERSSLNALWGSLNTELNTHYSSTVKKRVPAFPFDSYSPLTYGIRGEEVGGFRIFEDGTYYGCCVAIGAAGIALTPLVSVLRANDGFAFNLYFDGIIKTTTPNGNEVKIFVDGGYPKNGNIEITVECDAEEKFALYFRKPYWCNAAKIIGADYTERNGYFVVEKVWSGKEKFALEFPMRIDVEKLNGKTAFTYGPLTLAVDEAKGNRGINEPIRLIGDAAEEQPLPTETVRFHWRKADGDELIFTDYASSGKNWEDTEKRMSVWLDIRN